MKASAVIGTLICACFMVCALPAMAEDGAAKGKIGITLPTQNIEHFYKEGQFLTEALENEGYEVSLYYAGDNDLEIQKRQLERMVAEDCDVIVIGAVDCYGLDKELDDVKAKGIKVVSYGSMLMNTDAVDYMVGFDPLRTGEIQGNYLRAALKLDKATAASPITIEVFSGIPTDSNSKAFFVGAMSVLNPYIESGVLVIGSGQKDFESTCVGRSDEDSIRRMDSLLASEGYAPDGKKLDGVLSPSDIASEGIINSLERAGYTAENMPKITGQDCTALGVRNIESGLQSMSVFKDSKVLANSAVRMVASVMHDDLVRITNPGIDNGLKQVPAYECMPVYMAGGQDQYADVMIKGGFLTRNDIDNATY